MSLKLVRWSGPLVGALALAALTGCGGGGGGKKSVNPVDPTINVFGPVSGGPARLSRTPDEANADGGVNPPPSLSPDSNGSNHWFRLEFPFAIDRTTILDKNQVFVPFDNLNGNITVSDLTGDHVPGLALVGGRDVNGVNHATDIGFPHDVQSGVDRNTLPNAFVYVANVDYDLSTPAAFGYAIDAVTQKRTEVTAATIDTVRITVAEVNGFSFDAVWTIHIGVAKDSFAPLIVRAASEVKNPLQPTDPDSAAVTSSFIVEFSKPVIPRSVGSSALLDRSGNPYDGNMPRAPIAPPLPSCAIVATTTSSVGTLFVPFDCEPMNTNNLAAYRLKPLIDLPPNTSVDLVVRAITNNTGANTKRSPTDLSGNFYDGQDTDGDRIGNSADFTHTFHVGPGGGVVNIPVSPEVMYWLPGGGDGIGAIDLNGHGFTTNTPGANFDRPDLASIVTMLPFLDNNMPPNLIHGNGLNLTAGIALTGSPGNTGFPYDGYLYPIGTGGFAYGSGTTKGWLGFPTDTGNSGTLVPGINEMSSGFETLCRDSTGDTILTGREFGRVGNIQDMIVGEFLDLAYFDSESLKTNDALHVTIFDSPPPHRRTARGNTIADPPTPNPPPTRYWAGLPPIAVVLDQENPLESPLLIEGEEVFVGTKSRSLGYVQLIPNEVNPGSFDQTYFPHIMVGPAAQSATGTFTYSSRQVIGNYLYATDNTSSELQILNSNTMRVIKSIPLPDPSGLAIAPDLKRVFVSNFRDNTVSVINSDPFGPSFHQEVARVNVGEGPRAIAVQPDNEDVFCCNFLGNTISVISTKNLVVRKSLDALVSQPFDVELTERQAIVQTGVNFGWACGIYFGYMSNFGGNSVTVFESGPDGPQGIGIDGILGSLPTKEQSTTFLIEPRGLCATPFPDPAGFVAGGVFVAHKDENGFGRVSQIQFTQQAIFGPLPLIAPPGLITPPGFLQRQFEVTASWGNTDSNRLIGAIPVDVCLTDEAVAGYHNRPSGAPNLGAFGQTVDPVKAGSLNSKNHMRNQGGPSFPVWFPDRLYVCFADTDSIQVLDPNAGTVINTITGASASGGVKKLMSFWRE
jgi:YVTN family beta-propeller protein